MDWLKKNWMLLVLVIIAILAVSGWVKSCGGDEEYKEQITKLENENEQLKKEKSKAEEAAKEALERAEYYKIEVSKKEQVIAELNADLEKLKTKHRNIQKKIAKLKPGEIVNETKGIIKSDEVELRNLGIVFSIAASRKNLGVLKSFTFCEKEKAILINKIDKYEGMVSDFKSSISDLETACNKLSVANQKCENITINLEQKFKLCEISRKKKWWKGFFNGALAGGGIVAVLAILAK